MSYREDLTGKVYNGLEVLGFSHSKDGKDYWKVLCSCGKVRKPLRPDSLKKSKGTCTCIPIKGDVVGMFTLLDDGVVVNKKKRFYKVKCNCGVEKEVRGDTLLINKIGCGTCKNTVVVAGDTVTMDVSTKCHPKTYTTLNLEDYKRLEKYKWYAVRGCKTNYVQASEGKLRLSLHREILNCPEDLVVDHEDGDGLNNIRSNIRVTTYLENNRNLPTPHNNTSGHIGVSSTESGNWRAYITHDNRQVPLGTFFSYQEAVDARKVAEKLYGFHENHGRTNTLK
jgi:hypothetical protein